MALHQCMLLPTQTYSVTERKLLVFGFVFFFFLSATHKTTHGPVRAYRCNNPLVTIVLWGVLNRQLMKEIALIPTGLQHECEDPEKQSKVVGGRGVSFSFRRISNSTK